MRAFLAVFALAVLALLLALETNSAGEKKDTVLKGNVTCTKCDLAKSATCETVIVVKEKDKDVIYYFDKKGHEKYHEDICTTGAKKGTVTGTVKDEGTKKVVTVKKVEYAK